MEPNLLIYPFMPTAPVTSRDVERTANLYSWLYWLGVLSLEKSITLGYRSILRKAIRRGR